ncbi:MULTISPECIES: MFS transporter [Amycolatopsis]|uniref:Putative proline/betaine transporter n=1 Tax=Amycolatopsis dendrobii TaxID=2760662 RepID=A0A7W3ZDW4_9PSEU|nr:MULTISPECIES: MFS transporter [Amycolatopsis]MBB1157830.1 MFS transporter [Amycolatopsis dendrobii]UKD53995.1 MFS transporter [Amycolatopsis sp. FU40]
MTEAADGRGPSGGATVTDDATMRRAVGAAAVGNITEWFDFGVYGYLSTTIEAQFFPPGNPALAQLATFATFAVAFLVRPLGGLFFGPLGDKIGRTKVLAVTVILMATGTFLIGLIPSYSSIGLAAPILLVCARVLQGFSTGGEYAGAMTFIAEYSPDRRRGYFGSFLEFGTFIGYALGATVSSVLPLVSTPAFMDTWGWRIPFMVALPLGIVGVYLRTKLEETPAFQQLLDESGKREDAEAKHVVRTIFAKYWPTMLLAGGLVVTWNVTNYMLTSYMPTYLKDDRTMSANGGQAISATAAEWLQIGVLWLGVLLIPLLGRLSDKIGRKPILWVGAGGLIVLGLPMVLLLKSGSLISVLLGLVLMGLLLICFSSTCPSTLPALFPTEVRYGGLSISFNIFVSAFAGTVSLVMSALVLATGDLKWPGYYLMIAGVVGVLTLLKLKETAKKPLPGSAPSLSASEDAAAKASK